MGLKGRKSTSSLGTPAKLHECGCRRDKVIPSQPEASSSSTSNRVGPNTENEPTTQANIESELLTVSMFILG
jgi:hypothetical protein